jgi:hypothetical protein
MKLDGRQVRFITPFMLLPGQLLVRLGGRRGGVQLQETALVVEGELARFKAVIGVEWAFRRVLSEWTTLTVPYSRIDAARLSSLWPLRVVTILVVAGVVALAVWLRDEPALVSVVWVFGGALALLLAYINVRVKPSVRVKFRSKDGKRRMLAFVIRSRRLRKPFLDTLQTHRAVAARFGTPAGVRTGGSA